MIDSRRPDLKVQGGTAEVLMGAPMGTSPRGRMHTHKCTFQACLRGASSSGEMAGLSTQVFLNFPHVSKFQACNGF